MYNSGPRELREPGTTLWPDGKWRRFENTAPWHWFPTIHSYRMEGSKPEVSLQDFSGHLQKHKDMLHTKTLCLHVVAKPVKHDLVCCVGFSYCCLILLIVSHRPTRHRTRVDFYDHLQLRPVPMICSCQQVRFIKLSCSCQKYYQQCSTKCKGLRISTFLLRDFRISVCLSTPSSGAATTAIGTATSGSYDDEESEWGNINQREII